MKQYVDEKITEEVIERLTNSIISLSNLNYSLSMPDIILNLMNIQSNRIPKTVSHQNFNSLKSSAKKRPMEGKSRNVLGKIVKGTNSLVGVPFSQKINKGKILEDLIVVYCINIGKESEVEERIWCLFE